VKYNFLLLLALTALGHAQSSSPFTATGMMTTPRYGHTATLLTNGRVLIAGGSGNSAELYDPNTGTFAATGSMNAPRGAHTATLLADGRVLIAGGNGLASAELYDPVAGTFAATGSMMTERNLHEAALLRDGRVLVAGGFRSNGSDVLSAELYDPTTGTFSATGDLHRAWIQASATLLADGTVLIGAEVYAPYTGLFTDTGHPSHDYAYTATLLLGGTAFIAGGGDSDPAICLSATEQYQPSTATFAAARTMTLCRYSHTATLLPSGTVVLAGGASYDAGPFQANLASVEIYDFRSGTFGWIGDMLAGRQGHTATLLGDGRILIAGGVGAPGYSTLATAEIYSPPTLIPAPGLFSLSGDGKGQGAILHAGTSQVASSDNRAVIGEALEIYLTGLADGSVIPPQVSIGGRSAEILFFGSAPGFAGVNQVNVRVPNGVAPGSAVPVRLSYLGRPSNEVTIGVQ
jgi:hypothetical protein